MILWSLLTVLCCAACISVCIPLIRRYETSGAERSHLSVYQSQLAEIDRDEKSGQVNTQEAAVARAEVQRRMLASAKAGESAGTRMTPAMQNLVVFGTGLFVALGGVYLYSMVGRPDLASVPVAQAPASSGNGTAGVDTVDDKIAALEARMQASPSDPKGWRMLAWAYFNTGRYDKSVTAYGKALVLNPDDIETKSALAEAQIMAAGNTVTAQARALLDDVLRISPKDERARFYHSLGVEQAGDAAGALESWLALYADAPADAGWLADVRSHVETLAKQLGKDVAAQLAAKQPIVTAPGPDTNPDAAAAIQQMPAGDQQAMIKSMVQRLADKLKANPQDVEGWKRLIHARMILNEPAAAKQALDDALKAFSSDSAAQQALRDAASAEGVGSN